MELSTEERGLAEVVMAESAALGQVVEIELGRLRGHPGNCNVMPEHLLAKLVSHVRGSGRYPPLIVRPKEIKKERGTEPAYEVLDGHHRLEALRRLGHARAQCVVWEVDDEAALVLLATLNRLEGHDDPRKRGALVAELRRRMEKAALGRLVPETMPQLEKLLELAAPPPRPRAPVPLEQMPVAVQFFLLPAQRQRLEAVLRALGGKREEALMRLVEGAGIGEAVTAKLADKRRRNVE